jgi:group I intron endonuclease
MKIYTIYKATNTINNESYIGFDSNWPHRYHKHKSLSKSNKLNYHFYNALRKYGFDSFEWSILYQSKDRDHCKDVMENYFITEYDTFNNGYNSTKGGEGTFNHVKTPEGIERIRQANMGKTPWNKGLKLGPLSEEQKKKVSDSLKGKSAWNKGIPNTEEQKQKISQSLKDNNPMHDPENRKKVSESLKGRVFSDEWKRKLSEAAKNRVRKKKVES